MKKIVIAPDSFKGTLTSRQVCSVIGDCVREFWPDCQLAELPIADGGEGMTDCFLAACGGKRVAAAVKGPFFEELQTFFGLLPDGETAVIETASAAGLTLAGDRKDPSRATTYGVGEQILRAAEKGCRRILVGLGGSCTNDGGAGAAAACGVRFLDRRGASFVPTGGTLSRIADIDVSGLSPALSDCRITALCDIDNPLYGETGAAFVFAPQKGADEKMVRQLDAGLLAYSEKLKTCLGIDVSALPGGGAAGGLGAGLAAFFGAKLEMGIEAVLGAVEFDRRAAGAELVITGEGKLDDQSVRGKAVSGVAAHAGRLGIPAVAFVGGYDRNSAALRMAGLTAAFSINSLPEPLSVSRGHSAENLRAVCENVLRLIDRFSSENSRAEKVNLG